VAATRRGSRRAAAHEPEEDLEGNSVADGRSLRAHRHATCRGGYRCAVHDTSNNTGLEGGTPVIIKGVIRDGGGEPVKDAMVEIWQAGPDGQYGPGRKGWARSHTDFETGEFRFETVKPKLAGAPGVGQAPHVTLMIFARGINLHLHTRIYFLR
jgi:protocatechuate 3,4-dioxygenase beta subunit